jgi:hypothetical protein
MKRYIAPALLLLTGLAACEKEQGMGPVPNIALVAPLKPVSVKAGSSRDSVLITFNFTDGDADLGNSPSSGQYDIYTTDSRDTAQYNYFFPNGMTDVVIPGKGIQGTCNLKVEAAFLLLRPDHPDGDTLHYDLYIKDRAGHESNRVKTADIYLVP